MPSKMIMQVDEAELRPPRRSHEALSGTRNTFRFRDLGAACRRLSVAVVAGVSRVGVPSVLAAPDGGPDAMPDAVGPVVAAVVRDVAEPVAVGAELFVGSGAQEPNGSSVPS